MDINNKTLLENLNLLDHGLIKRAGILLFHNNPEKWIPGAYIKIGYFRNDSELEYQDEIHGSLLSQIEKVMDLLYTKYLKANITYKDITRIETYPFPKEAIREAVLNAIAHKFYGTLVPIQISVYKDKLYIVNDCIFPKDWTIKDLMTKHESKPYNPLIADTLFRAGFIESWGRGIDKIQRSCKNAGNKLPEYKIKDEFMIEFTSLFTTTQTSLNSAEILLLQAIRNNGNLSQKQISKLINEDENKIKYYFNKMKKAGIIKYKGTIHNGKWVIIEKKK